MLCWTLKYIFFSNLFLVIFPELNHPLRCLRCERAQLNWGCGSHLLWDFSNAHHGWWEVSAWDGDKKPRNAFGFVDLSLVQPTKFLSGNLYWLALNYLSVYSISYLSLQPWKFWFPAVLHSQCSLEVFNMSITVPWELLNFPFPVPGGSTAPQLLNWESVH